MGFKYVLIPASPNEEIKEIEYHEDVLDLTKDSFREFVQTYFAGLGGTVDRSVLLKQLQEKTGMDLEKHSGANVDQLLNATSVEIFPVLLPTKETEWSGISVYCDDKGIAKGLEENTRMSGLVQASGYPGQVFRGDCFIGKVFDDGEDVWKRVDFTMSDVNADADWATVTRKQRSNRSSGDMASLANTIGMQKNAAHVNGAELEDAAPNGETEQYCWRQAEDEVEITFKKDGLQKGDKKEVQVVFNRQKIKVVAKSEVLIDAELFATTQPDEATWTLSDGVLQVTLTKAEPSSWTRLLKA